MALFHLATQDAKPHAMSKAFIVAHALKKDVLRRNSELFGYGWNAFMTPGEFLSPITALIRLISALLGRKPSLPHKRLEARLLLRGIVAEIPQELPFHIVDEEGNRHRGIYVIGLLIWNKGNQPIVQSDLTPTAPLQVEVGADSTLVSARTVPFEDQTVCAATMTNPTTIRIDFDCINPNEYLIVPLFLTGNPMTEVKVTGRIIGQDSPIDHTAAEVKAPFLERLAVLIMLLMVINMLPGTFIAGAYLFMDYGLDVMWHKPESLPTYLTLPFMMGVMMLCMFIFSRVMYWFERRNYPQGYPLHADLEPPLLENIKGMLGTIFKGTKHRISTSLFDWGKPILLTGKKARRRSVDDWIR